MRLSSIYFLADNILFNVGIGIISSMTVIPDFVRRLTDLEILIGLLGALFVTLRFLRNTRVEEVARSNTV